MAINDFPIPRDRNYNRFVLTLMYEIGQDIAPEADFARFAGNIFDAHRFY